MPDEWEDENGLDATDPRDALGDADFDGVLNLREFQQGTDPQAEALTRRCSSLTNRPLDPWPQGRFSRIYDDHGGSELLVWRAVHYDSRYERTHAGQCVCNEPHWGG